MLRSLLKATMGLEKLDVANLSCSSCIRDDKANLGVDFD